MQVFIGEGESAQVLRNFGIVIATHGIDGEVTGILGVLGPTRMRVLAQYPERALYGAIDERFDVRSIFGLIYLSG